MRATPDFLTNLNKTDHSAQFGAYIRNKTARAVRIDVPFGLLEKEPRMTDEQHAALIERNKVRYSASELIITPNPEPPEAAELIVNLPPSEIKPPVRKKKPTPPKADDEDPTPAKDY